MENRELVVLEGFHVCKHAVRFGADIVELVTTDLGELTDMLEQYAPDIVQIVLDRVVEISTEDFANYSDVHIRTPLAGKAIKASIKELNIQTNGLVVLLDNPRDLENIGAVVRLSAGMDVGAVVTTGDVDPWHKNCLRGSQGLHFALPVLHMDHLETGFLSDRPMYVFDESGEDLGGVEIPFDAVLVFGSERQGVSDYWLKQATRVVKIPQQEGVSSYNLATSVAMGVYHAHMNAKT